MDLKKNVAKPVRLVILVLSFGLANFAVPIMASIGPYGGSIQSLAIAPSEPNIMYAAPYTYNYDNSIFKSTNGGENWINISTRLIQLSALSLAVDPYDADTVYAGGFGGLFKSTNGGAYWYATGFRTPISGYIEHIQLAIDPNRPSWVYADVLVSPGMIHQGYILRSTDGGDHWSVVWTHPSPSFSGQIVIDPQNSSTLYVATSYGILKSIDAGDHWFNPDEGRTLRGSARSAVIDPQNSDTLYVGVYGGMFKSTNGGSAWFDVSHELAGRTVTVITIDPNNARLLYAGTERDGFFESTDGGEYWQQTNKGLPSLNISSIVLNPDATNEIYVGVGNGGFYSQPISGGVFRRSHGGSSWSDANNGLAGRFIQSLVVDPRDSTLYASAGDLVKRMKDGNWVHVGPGTVANNLVIDPTDPNTIYSGGYWGVIYRTTDGGNRWSEINMRVTNQNIRALIIDPNRSNTLYAAAFTGVVKTTDKGETWSVAGLADQYLTTLAIAPTDSDILYAAGNHAFKSTDGGATWVEASEGLPTNSTTTYMTALAVDSNDPLTVYAGWNDAGIFKTTDGGQHWFQVNIGLWSQYISALAVDPTNSNTVYAATGQGVFKTTNGGARWIQFSYGLTNMALLGGLVIDPNDSNTLYVGTWNSGVFASYDGGRSWN